ncbi:MAG: hypothetical protein V8Q75_06515 [Bacilli bacterium]
MGFEVGDTQKLEAQYEKLSQQLSKLKQKQIDLNKTDLSSIQKNVGNVGNSVSDIVKKIGRWTLAVFGLRSAYMAVRGAMSTLSQYDNQMASNIEYIKYALANTLKPIIEEIINLVVKLLSYVNYIAQAWFGVNLFANASSKGFKDAQDNLSKTNKEAKELKKQLAGFDEMNVISNNSSEVGVGTGAGAGTTLPSFDLSSMQGEVPEWLKWITDNKEEILSTIGGITAGIAAWSLGLGGLKSLGFGVAIAGVVYAIQGLIEYLEDPSWDNFGKIITGIGGAVAGVAIMFGTWPVAVAGALIAIIGIIVSNWENIKSTLQNGIDWLTGKSDWIHEYLGDTIGNIYDCFVRTLQRGLDWLDLTFTSIKKIFDGIITFVKGVFTGDWKKAWEGIKQIFGGIWDWISGSATLILSGLIDKAKTIASTVGDVISGVFKAVVNGILSAIENILNKPINTINSLIKTINKVPGINLGKLDTFKLPRLAVGGIVNMPSRGVPIGGAIVGEAGAEGVIPLTDSQAMEELGSAIGRYITINLTNNTNLDGKTIARQQNKISANKEFAMNR